MGLLIEGQWHDRWYDTQESNGVFVRDTARFRNWITPDGEAGPSGTGGFRAEAGRYHLYVSLACPWAHRTLIFRKLKQLEGIISVSVVDPHMLDQGWSLNNAWPVAIGSNMDEVNGKNYLHEIYTLADPDCSGRVTVPMLWDKQRGTIVSNESSEIIRMFNSAFAALTPDRYDYYPKALRHEIDSINQLVYDNINNGVYRCGFATSQQAYDEAFDQLFSALDTLEQRLAHQRYLVGDRITEADWRLFATLIRFDAVYYSHFKCNRKRIDDYHHLANYLRELYQAPGIAETVDITHIKQHYYFSHDTLNPTRIVPNGPELDFDRTHDRDLVCNTSIKS